MTNKSIKVITFDLDDTFWDITPVIIRAEVETRKWIEQQLDSDIEWGNLEEFINLRERLIAENHSLEYDLSALRKASLKYHVHKFFKNKIDLDNFVNEAFGIFFNYRQQVKLFAGVKRFFKHGRQRLIKSITEKKFNCLLSLRNFLKKCLMRLIWVFSQMEMQISNSSG